MNTYPSFRSGRRGSILITTLLLAGVIAISLVSYLRLTNSSLKLASRSFYSNSAMNVAEIGLEQTIACFNQLDNNTADPTLAWPGWTLDSTAYHASTSPTTPSAKRTFTGLSAGGPDATASVKVYVHRYDGLSSAAPIIVAKSTITQLNAAPITKYIEVTLRKRALFANGLVARNNIDWDGTPSAKSWNSDEDNDKGVSTPAVAYDSSLNTANCVVASLDGDIDLASGTVWGYAKTGPDGSIVNGTVRGLVGGEDPARRTQDFNATFPEPTPDTAVNPNSITSSVTGARSFGDPASTDTWAMVNGVKTYYYVFSSAAVIDLGGSSKITMMSNCVFLMNNYSGTSTAAITLSGSQGLIIDSGASLKIYTNGNISLAGTASLNNNAQPSTFQIYGTNPTSQTITISGTADIKTVINAPNAAVTLNGSVSVQGAVIAKTIDMKGTPDFIYDESLANMTIGNPYGISKWRELQSATERSAYDVQLSF